jgi:kumamolisin
MTQDGAQPTTDRHGAGSRIFRGPRVHGARDRRTPMRCVGGAPNLRRRIRALPAVAAAGLSVLLCCPSPWASAASAPGAGRVRTGELTVTFLAELRAPSRPLCLESWARTVGLTVGWRPGNAWVTITGTTAAVDRGFGVTVSSAVSRGGTTWWASGTPRAPVATCGDISRFGALHSSVRPAIEGALSVPAGGLSPSQLLTAYDVSPLRNMGLQGQGETVVVFEVDAYRASDVATFADDIGAPLSLSDPFGNQGKVMGESTMDIEAIHEIAPKAAIVDVNLLSSQFSGSSTGAGFAQAFDLAARRWPGAIWSLSLGVCERAPGIFNSADMTVMDQAVSRAEQTGTTVFASSGDAGGLECMPQDDSGDPPLGAWEEVDVPAALPAVTGVGGTSLVTTSSGRRIRETTWTETLLSQGSSGGISSRFPTPSWQRSAVSAGQPAGREVPDVSADADPATGAAIIEGGRTELGGGTSLAAPLWAGFLALVDQYLHREGKPAAGFLNPAIYALAAGPAPYRPFFDVTAGGNDFFTAGPGYDLVTGLGSPEVWNLARDLAARE